jgi:hypothetical protein
MFTTQITYTKNQTKKTEKKDRGKKTYLQIDAVVLCNDKKEQQNQTPPKNPNTI